MLEMNIEQNRGSNMRSIQEEVSWDEFEHINVLIVDDDPFNRQLIMQILGKLPNVKVFEAQSGEEALLFLIENKDIDIILLDIHMPGMNGFETLKAIKESKEYKYVSVIIVTTDPDEKVKALEMGAVDLISKPYNADTIREKVYLYSKKQKSKRPKGNSKPVKKEHKAKYSEEDMENMQKSFLRKLILFNSVDDKSSVVAPLAYVLAIRLGWGKKEASYAYYSALLKDIGLIVSCAKYSDDYVFDETDKENYYQKIISGYRILENSYETKFLKICKKVILQYKEHYDGNGFPNGLSGKDISGYAYVVAMADMFYGLVTPKKYREKEIYMPDEIKNILLEERGKKLHPKVVDITIENYSYFIEILSRAKEVGFAPPA
jgi:putative two-component system response regulator